MNQAQFSCQEIVKERPLATPTVRQATGYSHAAISRRLEGQGRIGGFTRQRVQYFHKRGKYRSVMYLFHFLGSLTNGSRQILHLRRFLLSI